VNSSPKNPNAILEAADGSDDVDNHPAPASKDSEEDELEVCKPVETAEAQCSQSINCSRKTLAHPIPH
jgi:hypothetical protein